MNDDVLRSQLVELLNGRGAHLSLEDALKGLKAENRSKRPSAGIPSVWEELEHIRLAQEDILKYTVDPDWKSPSWPDGYWPSSAAGLTDEAWNATVKGIESDLKLVIDLVQDESRDLTAKIPHGGDHTYLREVLLVADHNAYHLGQIVTARKMLGDWTS